MGKLTYRSLLLSTVISMGHMVYGSDLESSGSHNFFKNDFESLTAVSTPLSVAHRIESRSSVAPESVNNDELLPEDVGAASASFQTEQAEQWRDRKLSELTADQIVKFLEAEYAKNAQLLTPEHTAKDKDIVVFLGKTGAGKSTFINFLAGKGLVVESGGYALEDSTDKDAMPIGTQLFSSETLYPKSIDIGGLRFFDLPGLDDTEGTVRNLVNAAFIQRIMLEAKSVRFVYVAGQDEFTASRGASIKEFTKKINELCVMQDPKLDPVKEGLLVVTKENQLIERIKKDLQKFPDEIKDWHKKDHIERMYSAHQPGKNNNEHRQNILERIKDLTSMPLGNLNVSALYPAETEGDLKRMYTQMFNDVYEKKKGLPMATVSEYTSHIDAWKRGGFWEAFEDKDFIEVYPAASILKGVTAEPYKKARDEFVNGQTSDRQTYINDLERRMNGHIEELKQQTEVRAESETRSIREGQRIEGVIPFDFANHVMYQERVCGEEVLKAITSDVEEHEIIRSTFSKWIGQYYQQQADVLIFKPMSEIKRLEQQLSEALKALDELRKQWNEKKDFIKIPQIVKGHEEVYGKFLNGKLVYKPNKDNDEGRKEFRIGDLEDPLSGTFDISGCGDSAKYLSISTGFRTGINPANSDKVEIWIVPQFVLQKDPRAKAFNDYLQQPECVVPRNKPFAVLFNWGGWSDLSYHHVVGDSGNDFDNLYDAERTSVRVRPAFPTGSGYTAIVGLQSLQIARQWQISLQQ